jgi:hypothetical protein
MAAERPYFKLGIAELESAFESAGSDDRIWHELLDELKHRNTDRASALLRKIEGAIADAQCSSSLAVPPIARSPFNMNRVAERLEVKATPISLATPAHVKTHGTAAEVTNKQTAILAAWTALEALSPQTYRRPADLVNGDTRCVAFFDGDDLPWFQKVPSRKNYQLYYQIVLGCVPVDQAMDELIKTFGDDEERSRKEREKAAIAAVLVDRNGYLLAENSVAISSFGWALPIALSGDLAGLGAWTAAEHSLVEGLTKQLSNVDDEGNALPLDGATLQKSFRWLVTTLKLPEGLYESPSFVLRIYHYFKSKNPPETTLLNSFFIGDLARATKIVDQGRAGQVLARYLGTEKLAQRSNLLEAPELIEALVAPGKMPAARWPAPGGHPLVTLQQAAVNAARNELAGSGTGLVAVNGPPGTGKTTLLRDIVASCVLDRATAMARFDDPLAAFKTTGQKVAAGDRAFYHLYSLDQSLKGHEVVVASSNNKAVENVSKELPALKAIGRNLSYFKTVSDNLLSKRAEGNGNGVGEPSWGLIAAVLGNAQNRYAFQQALWWDDDLSLRLYLKAAKGDTVVREIKDDSGRIVRREIPTIIKTEAPPTPDEARVKWKKARARFTRLHQEIDAEFEGLESIRKICLRLAPTREAFRIMRTKFDFARQTVMTRDQEVEAAKVVQRATASAEAAALRMERQAFSERPNFLHRLFNTKRAQKWRGIHTPLVIALSYAKQQSATAASSHDKAVHTAREAEAVARATEAKLTEAESALTMLERQISQHRMTLGDRMVDEEFFRQNHEGWNLSSPWLPDVLHRKREDLFAAALELHRSFIDVAAQKIAHNLGVLMGAMHAGAFQDDSKRALLGDLWSTLFMVCPVVSTTFASVDRMLGDLPSDSLGWVLIDEAGQATPQSAVGLLMRSKRAVIVGDPLQIPPVVSLPQRLILEVAKYFGVGVEDWIAPDASVQTLGDQASYLKSEFRSEVGIREVGIPLLVHRRCQEPMFGISNQIAYDGQMVHAVSASTLGPVATTLGPSRWLNVDGNAQNKWCPQEGEAVVQLLSKLAAAGVQRPDVYVITPFRIVAHELRRRIESEPGLLQRLGVSPDDWLRDRVGTIHTFQGKEAEAVIAVLGAPMATQQGARRWAASTPNIFNVMVSRAKQTIYVVGSRTAWSSIGHGKAVSSFLQ